MGGAGVRLVGGAELLDTGRGDSVAGAKGVGVDRVSAGVVRPNPFLTSSRDDVTGPMAPLGGPGVLTFLGSGSSPAFLARSLSAAAKVDMEEEGGEGPSTPGAGLPGEGEDGTD